MATDPRAPELQSATLPFDEFWNWIFGHPNCILRAGTGQVVVYDAENLHWQFFTEKGYHYAQLLQGKRLLSEIVIDPETVSYVEVNDGDREEETFFEMIFEREDERGTAYFFVLTHGFHEEEDLETGRAVH